MKRLISVFLITVISGILIYFCVGMFKKKEETNDIKYIFDMSFATTIKSNDLENLIKNNDSFLLMVGDKKSESSAIMSTYLKEIANDYDLKIYYLEKEKNDDIFLDFIKTDENLKEYGSFTPVLLVFKNNKFVSGYPGEAKYHNLHRFLKYNGIIKGEVKDE